MKQSPHYEDLYPHSQFGGSVKYRNQIYKYLYFFSGGNRWVFLFDPQTDGMTLTNAVDEVVDLTISQLAEAKVVLEADLNDLINLGTWVCRDSAGDYAEIKLTGLSSIHKKQLGQAVAGALPSGMGGILAGAMRTLPTSLRVKQWLHFDFSPELFELFKLLK